MNHRHMQISHLFQSLMSFFSYVKVFIIVMSPPMFFNVANFRHFANNKGPTTSTLFLLKKKDLN
jgi:hypothetical protein